LFMFILFLFLKEIVPDLNIFGASIYLKNKMIDTLFCLLG
jgi:hypothetical protein